MAEASRHSRSAAFLVAAIAYAALAVNLVLPGGSITDRVAGTIAVGAVVTSGAVIVVHRPAALVGQLLLLAGLGAAAKVALQTLAHTSESAPAILALAWTASWLLYVSLTAAVLLVLVFPGGTRRRGNGSASSGRRSCVERSWSSSRRYAPAPFRTRPAGATRSASRR